jgi:hypothetical protein
MKNAIRKCRTDDMTSGLRNMLLGVGLKPISLILLVGPIVGQL